MNAHTPWELLEACREAASAIETVLHKETLSSGAETYLKGALEVLEQAIARATGQD